MSMAVLVEAISVVIRCDRLLIAFDNDWDAFKDTVPNGTLCADNEVARVGFMSPTDVENYVSRLAKHGLRYIVDGTAKDLIVVDQQRGPAARCDWIEFGHINLDRESKKRVSACRLRGSTESVVVTPEGWTFEESLSASFGFVPNSQIEKSLTFDRHQDGLDVYHNRLTGKEVFIGRTNPDKES
jgi:hypothetical protein